MCVCDLLALPQSEQNECCVLNVCVLLKFTCWNPNMQFGSFGDEALRSLLGSEGEALMNGISAIGKWPEGTCLVPLPGEVMWDAVDELGCRTSPDLELDHTGTLIWTSSL